MFFRRGNPWLLIVFLLLPMAPVVSKAQSILARSWDGSWQTYWQTGRALVELRQDGQRVTGTHEPGEGEIDALIDGSVLSGTWREPGNEGLFVFALSDDGKTFAGRFGTGDYWNGFRQDADSITPPRYDNSDTPRDTMRSILLAANDAMYHGRIGDLRYFEDLLVYDGDERVKSDHNRRRMTLWSLLDISTFRIADVPIGPDDEGGRTATLPIGPEATGKGRAVFPAERRWSVATGRAGER